MGHTPSWIQPGATATLIWHDGAGQRPDGVRLYAVAGPILAEPPASPYFILVSAEQGDFAGRLYRDQVGLAELREFLGGCVLVRGELMDEMQWVAVREEAPLLPVLEAWRRAEDRPLLPYLRDIGAFMPGELPLFVGEEAVTAAQREPERFATAWVCDECGEAEDAGVFLWTARQRGRVRVCFLIENDAGVWRCRLHPFEFTAQEAI
jgi:hypothetical protein